MAVARHWRQQDQRYNLAGSRCGICGDHFFPKRAMCPTCHRRSLNNMERFLFSGRGRILSYTIVHDGSSKYRTQVPYIMAIIELEEGDMILGQVVDCDKEEIDIGNEVEMVFRKLTEDGKSGTIQYGYKFRLIDN
jgi:uncharacterized OB-fold protein